MRDDAIVRWRKGRPGVARCGVATLIPRAGKGVTELPARRGLREAGLWPIGALASSMLYAVIAHGAP
mgnify:CR=1 FL=1